MVMQTRSVRGIRKEYCDRCYLTLVKLQTTDLLAGLFLWRRDERTFLHKLLSIPCNLIFYHRNTDVGYSRLNVSNTYYSRTTRESTLKADLIKINYESLTTDRLVLTWHVVKMVEEVLTGKMHRKWSSWRGPVGLAASWCLGTDPPSRRVLIRSSIRLKRPAFRHLLSLKPKFRKCQ